ncbi:MAG: FkbM family methyltransferase [Synechococcaceae cyanobacterium SM2_3_1]|nr:FkbM family methyltransferase [Synechococcaceae cyanobacterium SM2_3_1]
MPKIDAALIQQIVRRLSVPGRFLYGFLKRYGDQVHYPEHPTLVQDRYNLAQFEISNYREYIQRSIYYLGYWEIRETRLLRKILRPGDTFVDVGANIGWFSILAAQLVQEQGQVLAFEPSEVLCGLIRRNIEVNGLKNIQLEKLALSNRSGRAQLIFPSAINQGAATLRPVDSETSALPSEEIETIRFDEYDWPQQPDSIRLLKIDTEGAEPLVLEGMANLIQAQICEFILFEISRELGSERLPLLSLFPSYDLFRITLFSLIPINGSRTELPDQTFNVLACRKGHSDVARIRSWWTL